MTSAIEFRNVIFGDENAGLAVRLLNVTETHERRPACASRNTDSYLD